MNDPIPVKPQRTKCWRPKRCFALASQAIAAAGRLKPRPGRLVCYYCPRHCSFHLGHEPEEKPPCTQ